MEEQEEGGKPSLAGGLSPGPPSAAVQAGAGAWVRPSPWPPCPQGAGGGAAARPRLPAGGCCQREGARAALGAATAPGLGPQRCISAPRFHQLGTAWPLCTLLSGVRWPPKAPAVPGKPTPRPPASSPPEVPVMLGAQAPHHGLPGGAAGPPLPPQTQAGSWGSRPGLGAAFSLVRRNLPGETISSEPKT